MGKTFHNSDLFGVISKNAVISDCGKYRYALSRSWDSSLPSISFIMLNPSKADAEQDDNTVTKCINFARSWGYGGIQIGNLYAFRSKEPSDLLKTEDPIGSSNELYLQELIQDSLIVVCAWGNATVIKKLQAKFPDYDPFSWIPEDQLKKFKYLRLSIKNVPWHPLYLPKSTRPMSFHSKVDIKTSLLSNEFSNNH